MLMTLSIRRFRIEKPLQKQKIAEEVPDLKANVWFHDNGGIIGNKDQLRRAHAIFFSGEGEKT